MIDVICDLSHWQASVDFVALRASGILAVLCKATQGSTWIDPTFVRRVIDASAAGLLVGAYHFADASAPSAQVTHFLTVAGHATPLLAVDIEPNGMGETVSVAQAAEIVARLHAATGRLPLVYIGRFGPSGIGAGLPNSILSRCPLWLPAYTAPSPICPPGWSHATLWQYTDKAAVQGVSGPCDRSRFAGTVDELRVWWASPTL